MRFTEKRFTLRDGRQALLRNPDPEGDAEEMVQRLTKMCGETEYLLRYPEECAWTAAQEREILSEANASDRRLMLVCQVGGEIAGMCGLTLYGQIKFRHRAEVDIALLRRYWGLGIGTAMLEAMTAVARERGARQLELDYIEGNERGRALYERMGFVQVAEHPDAVRLKDGGFRKLIHMMKLL